jgi:hypothetical protein
MVIGPNDGVIDKALSDRRAGVTLARAGHFRRLLPGDNRAHFSGMVYQNAGELLRLVGQGAAAATTPDQQKQAQELAEKLEPMLVTVYGGEDRIELASQGSAFSLLTQSMVGPLLHLGPAAGPDGTSPTDRSYRKQ